MKKTSIASALLLIAGALLISGCIFPYWGDEGGGGHGGGGGYRGEGHRGGGEHGGGERH